ncbi:uncharacterized protein [Amphiura filiformis]|uniref:uncharacterized protein n=1 Tax=Amphiura filiformis TaxID=82378 RepID=UPI003B22282A
MMGDDVTPDDQTNRDILTGEDDKTSHLCKEDVNGNNNALSSSSPDPILSSNIPPDAINSTVVVNSDNIDNELRPVNESRSKVIQSEEVGSVNDDTDANVVEEQSEDSVSDATREDDIACERKEEIANKVGSSLLHDDLTTKTAAQVDTDSEISDIHVANATNSSNVADEKQATGGLNEKVLDCQSGVVLDYKGGVNENYNHNNCTGEEDTLNLNADCAVTVVVNKKQDIEIGNITQHTSIPCKEDLEVAEILGNTSDDKEIQIGLDDNVTEADVLETLAEIDEIIDNAEKAYSLSSNESEENQSLKSVNEIVKDQETVYCGDEIEQIQSDTEVEILKTLTDFDEILEAAEKADSSSESEEILQSASSASAGILLNATIVTRRGESKLSGVENSVSLSESENEMGRRSLSFKRKTQHMVYTQDEFREQYTNIERGKSLDSSSKQDLKRGFQRLKAERAGNRPLRHTRSLSTPAVGESYSDGPSPRNKAGRPISMVDHGTDTSEFFKDHNTQANLRLRGHISPNETNNNKNIESKSPTPLQIEVKPDLEIRPQKAQNVNAEKPKSPTSEMSPRNSSANQDLSITSGYDMKVGVTKPGESSPTKQKRISLKNHLQNGGDMMNGTSPKTVNNDIRKTEIAIERQMMVKQAIKGSPEDRLSPRATLPSPTHLNGSVDMRTDISSRATLPSTQQLSESSTPPASIQQAGPFTVTTRIVDGEEELTIGNIPMETRPQSAPVMPSPRPRHFACIEPVGQPVVGHPPRMSHIEPVLVKRPASQPSQSISSSAASSDRFDDGPDTLSAMMSVTVTASTMPELQKPQVTKVTSDETEQAPHVAVNNGDIVPQAELVVEAKKELPMETTDGTIGSLTETKSTSPVVSNSPSPIPESAKSTRRFVFPSLARDESIEVTTDEEEDERGIYDASFRNSGWIYIGGNQELQMITGPMSLEQQQKLKRQQQPAGTNSNVVKAQVESKPSKKNKKKVAEKKSDDRDGDEDDVFSREDPARESSGTTASEEEFKKQYQSVALRRIQRKQTIMDYQRLSQIAREREVIIEKQNNLFGFRIQYSKPVVVTDIDQGGAAEKAGLKVGDMVLKVNGQNVVHSTHSQVVKLAAAGPEKLVLLVGTNVCNTLNLEAVKPVMTGHLWKMGGSGVFSTWKKRWFVLKHDNVLYYYKTKEDAEPLGAIVLCNYTVVKARDVGKPNAFKLTKHKARTFHMYSQTAEEMNSWAKAITDSSRPNSSIDIWLDISTHNVSIPALSIKYPDCHGILTKMGGRRKTWKRRYCVLKDACLYYYKDIDAPQALGVAHFHGYSIQETEIGSKKYAFILKAPEEKLRTFYFIADHETDRKRWVAAFAYSIGRWIQTNTGDDSDEEGNEMLI